MNDADYISVFHRLVLPIAYSYAPEIILVSAGFDAGVNDLLGSYHLTPEVFGHFIQLIRPLAQGRIVLTLEGGYNLTTTAYSMQICVKALLGDPLPKLSDHMKIEDGVTALIENLCDYFGTYWPVLKMDKVLLYR